MSLSILNVGLGYDCPPFLETCTAEPLATLFDDM